jgi:hypothetical protein
MSDGFSSMILMATMEEVVPGIGKMMGFGHTLLLHAP